MESVSQEQIQEALAKVKETVDDFDQQGVEQILENLYNEGKTISESIGLDKDFIELAYACCYNMYQAGRYSEALPVFQLLEVLKDDDERFSLGIAKCYEAQEEWELAILKYLGLTKFHPDPYLIWNAYLCAEKLKNQQFTMAILGMLYSETIDLPEYEELNEKAETLMIKKAEKMAEETVKEQG